MYTQVFQLTRPVYFEFLQPGEILSKVFYNKFMSKPSGLYVLHNTIIPENRNTETYSNAHFRNNLFLGVDAPQRPITVFPVATAYSTFDYNGYRPNKTGGNQYVWISPTKGQIRDYTVTAKDAQVLLHSKTFQRRVARKHIGWSWITIFLWTCAHPTLQDLMPFIMPLILISE